MIKVSGRIFSGDYQLPAQNGNAFFGCEIDRDFLWYYYFFDFCTVHIMLIPPASILKIAGYKWGRGWDLRERRATIKKM